MLNKYNPGCQPCIEYETLEVQPDLSYIEQPLEILDQQDRVLRNKSVPLVKVLWRNPRVEESTWELKSEMLDSILICLPRLILRTESL